MKILFAIMTCKNDKPEYRFRRSAQDAAWVNRARALGWDVQEFDGQRLGVKDDYYHLSQKTQGICKYAVRENYDALMKLDDDTYIDIEKFTPPLAEYAGIFQKANDYGTKLILDWPAGTFPFPYASGGAYWMTRAAFTVIANAPEHIEWAEDRWVGNTLAKSGIFITPDPQFGFDATAVIGTQLGARGLQQIADNLLS